MFPGTLFRFVHLKDDGQRAASEHISQVLLADVLNGALTPNVWLIDFLFLLYIFPIQTELSPFYSDNWANHKNDDINSILAIVLK